MKFLLLKVNLDTSAADKSMDYPDGLAGRFRELQSKGAGVDIKNHALRQGDNQAEHLHYVEDELAEELAEDPRIEILTLREAREWCRVNDADFCREDQEEVRDQSRIDAVRAKAALIQAEKALGNEPEDILTAEDRAALDPDDPTPGHNRRDLGLEKFGEDQFTPSQDRAEEIEKARKKSRHS